MAALVAAIPVGEADPPPTEMAGESSPLAASVLTKNGRAKRALWPAMTRVGFSGPRASRGTAGVSPARRRSMRQDARDPVGGLARFSPRAMPRSDGALARFLQCILRRFLQKVPKRIG